MTSFRNHVLALLCIHDLDAERKDAPAADFIRNMLPDCGLPQHQTDILNAVSAELWNEREPAVIFTHEQLNPKAELRNERDQ